MIVFQTQTGSFTNNTAYPITDSSGNITNYASKHSLTPSNYNLWTPVLGSSYTVGDTITIKVWLMLGTATNWCLVVDDGYSDSMKGVSFNASHGLNTSTYTQVSFSFIAPNLPPSHDYFNMTIGGTTQFN